MDENSSVAEMLSDDSQLVVAFASSDGECVNQHFGSSQGFEVFTVSGSDSSLISSKRFPKEKKDGNEDKLKPKLAFLHGCDLVYVRFGGRFGHQAVALPGCPSHRG